MKIIKSYLALAITFYLFAESSAAICSPSTSK